MRLAVGLAILAVAFAATASAQMRMGPRAQPMDPALELQSFRKLEQAFSQLAPQRRGQVDAYVLSVALWDEHVFENEAKGAADVLSQRFNAAGRTIVLSNGQGIGRERAYAGARPAEVGAALARLGEVMDKEEDVLVLFLTSHGQQDGAVGIQDQFRSYAIYPAVLREALDKTGIRNRLVIVSACFSGAFIPALQDARTIVLTAAAHDRTSFGCVPENDWTYFGDAFINQTMRQNRPLADAFDTAKILIESWEARENIRPSLPQSYMGAETRPILSAMTGRAR